MSHGDHDGFWIESLRIVALCSFAVAQPLYDVLGEHAQFFISRGAGSIDVAFFILAISAGVPGVALLLLAGARLLDGRLHRAVLMAIIAGLVAAIALPGLNRIGASAALTLAGAAALGSGFAVAYARVRWVRSFTTACSAGALVFPVLFVFATPVSKLVLPGTEVPLIQSSVAARTPVILVVFDLLPTAVLMNEHKRIDAERFPAFADLARHSVWFRNATSVAGNTVLAVPPILTGVHPRENALALDVDYPANLFTWLAPSHELHVFESETRLCPRRLCGQGEAPAIRERLAGMALDTGVVLLHVLLPESLRTGFPPINAQWHGFTAPLRTRESKRRERHALIREGRSDRRSSGRLLKFLRFVRSLESPGDPKLGYLHVSLPHAPFVFLPSGQTYVPQVQRLSDMRLLLGVRVDRKGRRSWGDADEAIRLGYQRLTLQVGFVDHLLGTLLAKLRALDLFDRALLIVVADHGMSFRSGQRTRLETDGSTFFVPLFVKQPGQLQGEIDDRNAQTLDVVPTVADVLGSELPWSVDGRSLLDPDEGSRGYKEIFLSRSRRRARGARSVRHGDWLRMLDQSLEQKLRLTGAGPWMDLYRTGPWGELVGSPLAVLRRGPEIGSWRFEVAPGVAGRVKVDQRSLLAHVKPEGAFVPAYLTGRLRLESGAPLATDLLVSINGTVRATTRSEPESERESAFAVMLPAGAFVPGWNHVEFFTVHAISADRVRVTPLRLAKR